MYRRPFALRPHLEVMRPADDRARCTPSVSQALRPSMINVSRIACSFDEL